MSDTGAEALQRGREIGSLASERARYHYKNGANCAESVLAALPEALGRPDLAVPPSIAAAWAGGIADQGCLCGALAAAVMVAGACAGADETNRKSRDKTAKKTAAEIKAAFEQRYDSSCCRVIRRKLEPDNPQSTKHCVDITAEAAAIAAGILAHCADASPEARAADAPAQRTSDRRSFTSLLSRSVSRKRGDGEARP